MGGSSYLYALRRVGCVEAMITFRCLLPRVQGISRRQVLAATTIFASRQCGARQLHAHRYRTEDRIARWLADLILLDTDSHISHLSSYRSQPR